MKKINIILLCFNLLLIINGCNKVDDPPKPTIVEEEHTPCPGTPIVEWKGQTYNTVKIGNQCWLKENLNWETGNSWCYDNNLDSCSEYGRLYNWETMMNNDSSSNSVPSGVQGICPDGWHIPSDAEWKILEGTVDSEFLSDDPEWDEPGWRGDDAGGNLKEAGLEHWDSFIGIAYASNYSGFTALPGGTYSEYSGFQFLGSRASFWSSTEENEYNLNGWFRKLSSASWKISRAYGGKDMGRSVRCIKD